MRALPNMAIVQPCDAVETHRAVDYLLEHDGPAFLRLTRQKLDAIHGDGYTFQFGKAEVLRDGDDIALVATGALVQESLKAAELLAGDGIQARVLNVHTIAPFDDDAIVAAARDTGASCYACEDHNVNGGLGSAVAEALAESGVERDAGARSGCARSASPGRRPSCTRSTACRRRASRTPRERSCARIRRFRARATARCPPTSLC